MTPRRAVVLGLLGSLTLLAAGAPAPPAAGVRAPLVRVIGTAQDGGFPHAACACSRCRLARQEPAHARAIASLALILPPAKEGPHQVFLIDATPDVREQLDSLADVREAPADRVDRTPVDGVLLTHAHIGHYLGLAFFGFEAVHPQGLPVYCTPRMAAFLRGNGPWGQQVSLGNLDLRESPPGRSFRPGGGAVTVEPLQVPHRDEYSDTVGYFLEGPSRRLLYVPDTDSWRAWKRPLPEVLEGVDVAILDGSFYSLDELPGRAVASIGHPLITETLDLLQPLVDAGLEVYFTHFNHSNPVLDGDGSVRKKIEARGFRILEDGQEIPL